MRNHRGRLDRLAAQLCGQRRRFRWYQRHDETGIEMVGIHLDAMGVDPTRISDDFFLEITGLDHYLPQDELDRQLIGFVTGLGCFSPENIAKNPSWCLAIWIQTVIEVMADENT